MYKKTLFFFMIVFACAACNPVGTDIESTKITLPSPAPTNNKTPTQIQASVTSEPTYNPAVREYSFSLDKEVVNVFWNEDGSMSLFYQFTFSNDPQNIPIDFVDVYVPSQDYDFEHISAEINGQVINHIEESTFFPGAVEFGLGENEIPAGATSEVLIQISNINGVLFSEPSDDGVINAVFFPSWFGEEFLYGNTNITVIFHLPQSVKVEEAIWHHPPPGWPAEPIVGESEHGRITFTWQNGTAKGYSSYLFGISFPKDHVPESSIMLPEQLDPMIAVAYFIRGVGYESIGLYELSLADLAMAIALDPNKFCYLSKEYSELECLLIGN
ncbi:MAG: hypothetical protein HOF10_06305 [Chloroflexi bacterium]|nr:hypothetical protein [Chloroflexota bacterium]